MITMEHVCKSYRIAKRNAGFREACRSFFRRETEEIQALKDVSFTIRDGEMVGYIGPYGAGKSSTIKILSGILTPDSGTVLVDDRVPHRDRIAHVKEIGVVFGQRSQLWWDIPVIDSFELLKDIYTIPDNIYKKNLEELTGLLNLGELLRSLTRQLSLGQRMRCEIAASLLHEPRILFLDEPTIGLDAVSKLAVREFILLTGGVIPLPFFPDNIRKFMELLPFAAMQNVALRIYSGSMSRPEMLKAVTLQLFWLAAVTAAGKMLCRMAVRRVVVQGG